MALAKDGSGGARGYEMHGFVVRFGEGASILGEIEAAPNVTASGDAQNEVFLPDGSSLAGIVSGSGSIV